MEYVERDEFYKNILALKPSRELSKGYEHKGFWTYFEWDYTSRSPTISDLKETKRLKN